MAQNTVNFSEINFMMYCDDLINVIHLMQHISNNHLMYGSDREAGHKVHVLMLKVGKKILHDTVLQYYVECLNIIVICNTILIDILLFSSGSRRYLLDPIYLDRAVYFIGFFYGLMTCVVSGSYC